MAAASSDRSTSTDDPTSFDLGLLELDASDAVQSLSIWRLVFV